MVLNGRTSFGLAEVHRSLSELAKILSWEQPPLSQEWYYSLQSGIGNITKRVKRTMCWICKIPEKGWLQKESVYGRWLWGKTCAAWPHRAMFKLGGKKSFVLCLLVKNMSAIKVKRQRPYQDQFVKTRFPRIWSNRDMGIFSFRPISPQFA